MKTRGIEVVCGYLVIPFGRGVPEAFWGRLKHAMTKAALLDAFRADYLSERECVRLARIATEGWESATQEADREEALFRRWVEKAVGPQELWPWSRGWTEELVDSYLQPEAARRAA
jgi:hypothetical protein